MWETSKAVMRRSFDHRYATRYYVGRGIDIGSGNDPLGNFRRLFPLMTDVQAWDLPQGDATYMKDVADGSFDFVNSSHCLEHLDEPLVALQNWIRICKPGGHLVIVVPDEDLYEQREWPSTFNPDHRFGYTIGKAASWCPQSVNVIDLLKPLLTTVEILKIELLDIGFVYHGNRCDQTMGLTGESAIEIILRKTV